MRAYSFTKKEEIVHAITHGVGALFSIVALVLLLYYSIQDGNLWDIASVSIFGITMFIMYLASTIVHSLPKGKWKDLFLIFDYAAIYLFIAGSYTPFLLIVLRGETGWFLFAVIWGLALVGIVFKVFFAKKFNVLSTLFYMIMGWLIVFAWEPLTKVMPDSGIKLLVIGGVFYTVGTVFYLWRTFPYHHAVWHLFVLIGSTCHFFTVFFYVL